MNKEPFLKNILRRIHKWIGVAILIIIKRPLTNRWISSEPNIHLTWNIPVSGAAFVDKLNQYGVFNDDACLLEIGPGYGRILESILLLEHPFGFYIGLDISEKNIFFLRNKFKDPRISFINGNAENYISDVTPTCIFSSLTFKHLFPSFEPTLINLANRLNIGGLIIFDLIESKGFFKLRWLEPSNLSTYIREYTLSEIREILYRSGLDLIAFDEVWHSPSRIRLLVCSKKR